MAKYRQNIQHVQAGEPGRAAVPGRPDRQLEGNVQYLRERMDAADLGAATFLRDATVESTALLGQPVYYNSDTQRYELALAGVETDPSTGVLRITEASDCVGVIYSKTNDTLADILTLGTAELDISNAVSGAVTPGRYYLSAGTPGRLVNERPGAGVPVLRVLGDGLVLVAPTLGDFISQHLHFSFELTARPAGTTTPPSPGDRHTITAADTALPGWLPADDPSFEGKAPAGASFGYNLAAHAALNRVWPPLPVAAARLTWDKGQDAVGGTDVPRGIQGLVEMDANGIWWMSDCYGDVPWPTDLDTSASSSLSESVDECPRNETMHLTLDFLRMTFNTATSVVTSLKTEGARLELVNCDGDPATTGDLVLSLVLDFLLADAGTLGHKAVKSFDPDTLTFQTGSVVEGLLAGDGVTLESATTRLSDPDDEDSETLYQGSVRVTLDADPLGRELSVEEIRVEDSRLRIIEAVLYLALVADQESSFIGKIKVPPVGMPASPSLKLRVVFYVDQAGSLPAVTLAVTTLPRPSTPAAMPTTPTSFTLDVAGVGTVAAGDYFEVESEAFDVAAGDTLFFEIVRAGDDGYDGELGVVRVGAVVQ